MGVVFTSDAAKKIQKAVKRVLGTPQDRVGDRNPGGPLEGDIWGWITGSDGNRFSFVRVMPDTSEDSPDLILDSGLTFKILDADPAHILTAYEVNNNKGVETGAIVKLSFSGYNADGDATFLFQWQGLPPDNFVPIHDHRDNFNGGFAFAVYHPGTSLPQQKWFL